MVKRLAAGVRSLYVSPSGGSSSREISCAIFASVLTWKEPVRLMTIGMITMGSFQCPWFRMACFRGVIDGVDVVYDFMHVHVSGILTFYKLKGPRAFVGKVRFEDTGVGVNVLSYGSDYVWFIVSWSHVFGQDIFWQDTECLFHFSSRFSSASSSIVFSPAWSARSGAYWASVLHSLSCSSKSVTGCLPRSMAMVGHLPPFSLESSWWSSVNVMLCRLVLAFCVAGHPPSICV